MKRIPAVIAALYRGRQLANVETWKVASTATAALSAFLTALAGIALMSGWIDEVPSEHILAFSSWAVTGVSLVLGYLNVATTKKIGLTDPAELDDSGDSGLRSDELPTGGKPKQRDPFGAFGE